MLKELIDWLEKQPQKAVIHHGFGKPMSYRGYYEDVAFEPVGETTIGQMLLHAKSAHGATFTGYKGGDFTMSEYTTCWIANYGTSDGDKIGPTMMRLWAMQAEKI